MSSGKSSGRIEIQECSNSGTCYVSLSHSLIATPDEDREILGLKGLEKVSW